MSLNIKNPRAYQLAAEIAAITGESLTTAVIVSLEHRLRQEQQRRAPRRDLANMRALARRFHAAMDAGFRSEDHATMLYDEHGLPK